MDQSLVHTFSRGNSYGRMIESSSKVSPCTGIGPWLALPSDYFHDYGNSERAKGAEKASCGESVVQNLIWTVHFFSGLYSLAVESGVGDSKLQFYCDQWLIEGGMGVLGPVACVHCV